MASTSCPLSFRGTILTTCALQRPNKALVSFTWQILLCFWGSLVSFCFVFKSASLYNKYSTSHEIWTSFFELNHAHQYRLNSLYLRHETFESLSIHFIFALVRKLATYFPTQDNYKGEQKTAAHYWILPSIFHLLYKKLSHFAQHSKNRILKPR